MQKGAIKDLIYGGIEEILNNRNYYYHSTVGAPYSHLTEDGRAAVLEFVELMSFKIKEANEVDLNHRAKQQVLETLKTKTS